MSRLTVHSHIGVANSFAFGPNSSYRQQIQLKRHKPPTIKEVAREMGSSHQNVKQIALKLEQNMKNAFPEELLKKAIVKECFGVELRTEKMNLVHKILTGVMKKATAKDGKVGGYMKDKEMVIMWT